LTILVLTAISVVAPTFGTSSVLNPGPHGLSEILYAFTSGTGNKRVGVRRSDREYEVVHISLAMAMLIGRFFMIIPMLAIAGSLGRKKRVPRRPVRSPSPPRCFPRCSSASSSSSARSRFSRP